MKFKGGPLFSQKRYFGNKNWWKNSSSLPSFKEVHSLLSFWHSNNVKCLFFLLIDDWICCEISLFHAVRCACVRKSKDIKKSIFSVYFKGGLIQKFDLRLWIFSDTFSINSWWSHFCDFTSENCFAKMGLNDR